MIRTFLTAVMAAAIIASLAAPSASATGPWKHHDTAITENKTLRLTGTFKIAGEFVGGVECQTTSTLTLVAGSSTANLTQFEPDLDAKDSTVTTKCQGSGVLVHCQIHAVQPKGLNWTVHNWTQLVEITTGHIQVTITGTFCPANEFTITPGGIVMTPSQKHTIKDFALTGVLLVELIKGSEKYTQNAFVSGKQEVLDNGGDSKPGTYSLT